MSVTFEACPGEISCQRAAQAHPAGAEAMARPDSARAEFDDNARILVVDDDPGVRALLRDFLVQHGFTVDGAADARAMQDAMESAGYDLVILDIMLPGENGLSICRRLIAENGPRVIMLSAMGETTDRVVGLELGADDYLTKPCEPRELLARVRAVLRRRTREAEEAGEPRETTVLVFAGWSLDLIRRELLSPTGVTVHLSSGEFGLLRVLLERAQRVLTRDQLLEFARGSDSDAFDRAVDVQISRLRRKLGDKGDVIRTVRSEGYMLDAKVTAKPAR
jgi:two-component system OmpR family response regulator